MGLERRLAKSQIEEYWVNKRFRDWMDREVYDADSEALEHNWFDRLVMSWPRDDGYCYFELRSEDAFDFFDDLVKLLPTVTDQGFRRAMKRLMAQAGKHCEGVWEYERYEGQFAAQERMERMRAHIEEMVPSKPKKIRHPHLKPEVAEDLRGYEAGETGDITDNPWDEVEVTTIGDKS